jgi:hypothetical protein
MPKPLTNTEGIEFSKSVSCGTALKNRFQAAKAEPAKYDYFGCCHQTPNSVKPESPFCRALVGLLDLHL